MGVSMKFSKSLFGASMILVMASSAHAGLVDNSLATWQTLHNAEIHTWNSYDSSQQSGLTGFGGLTNGDGSTPVSAGNPNNPLPAPNSGNGGNNIALAYNINNVGCTSPVPNSGCQSSNSGVYTSTTAALVTGQTYTLSYFESAVDRFGFGTGTVPNYSQVWATGATIGWDVTLGGQTIATDIINGIQTPAPGERSDWVQQTVTFTYTGPSGIQVLKFIGDSSPSVLPEPIVNLNCVNLVSGSTAQSSCGSVPEPNILWLLFAGVMGAAVLKLKRRPA
jgi:hypothetical protein